MAIIIKKTFEQWCKENNRFDLLDRFDCELNKIKPSEIGCSSNKKYYFKCPRGLHESELYSVNYLTKKTNKKKEIICKKCNSIGQFIIDKYGIEYLNKIWSSKNTKSYYKISKGCHTKVWLKCLNKNHPEYEQLAVNLAKGCGCPYCAGVKLCFENSFGNRYPNVLTLWSDKNKKTPYDYTYGSGANVFFKCENGLHDDYKREICNAYLYNFRCPVCANEERAKMCSGENSSNWKGGITPEVVKIRKSLDYNKWRDKCYNRDNFTCQCCGKFGGKLRAHHILNFSNHKDLRFDVNNGITLCEYCHDTIHKNTFHSIYGTKNNTPTQLEEYINSKRKTLNIKEKFSMDEYLKGRILKPQSLY